MKKFSKISLLLTFVVTLSFGIDFGCSDESRLKLSEKKFCNNQEFVELDNNMSKVYKKMLEIVDNKEALKKEQESWYKYIKEQADNSYYSFDLSHLIRDLYLMRTFYLKSDGFYLAGSSDNKTCKEFVDILNANLKKYKDINISDIEEFNWIKWEVVADKESYGIDYGLKECKDCELKLTFFDINNEGEDKGIFLDKYRYRDRKVLNMFYTEKKNAVKVKEYDDTQEMKKPYFVRKYIIDYLGAGFGNYKTNYRSPIKDNDWAISNVDFYPMKLNNLYYVAVFGTMNSAHELYIEPKEYDTMARKGDVVILTKFNNYQRATNGICKATRANPHTKKMLKYIKDMQKGSEK